MLGLECVFHRKPYDLSSWMYQLKPVWIDDLFEFVCRQKYFCEIKRDYGKKLMTNL
jgi:hypothetical protein